MNKRVLLGLSLLGMITCKDNIEKKTKLFYFIWIWRAS